MRSSYGIIFATDRESTNQIADKIITASIGITIIDVCMYKL